MKCVYWTERLKEHLQLPYNNPTLTHKDKKETSIEFMSRYAVKITVADGTR